MSRPISPEVYLGDGLYARYRATDFILYTDRNRPDWARPDPDWVSLEPLVLVSFLRFIGEQCRGDTALHEYLAPHFLQLSQQQPPSLTPSTGTKSSSSPTTLSEKPVDSSE